MRASHAYSLSSSSSSSSSTQDAHALPVTARQLELYAREFEDMRAQAIECPRCASKEEEEEEEDEKEEKS